MKQLFAAMMLACSVAVSADTDLMPLQSLIDNAEDGDVIALEPGVYQGPITIEAAIVLDGQGHSTIDAGGKGSVIYLDADGASIRNLRLINSGSSHNDVDSGIQVRGNFNTIKDNVIEDCLFGVDLQQSEFNILRRNQISSKDFELGQRGDAIRLWYSFNNKVLDNVITASRDTVVWYSRDNVIKGNRATGGRYSLHFMYSQYNLVEDNHYADNAVGIFLMYSDGVILRNNFISHAIGATGLGLGLKETSEVTIENNDIVHCGVGIYLDVSPYQPDTINIIRGNELAYNGVGVLFHNDWPGNLFQANRFRGNMSQVAVSGSRTAKRNQWKGNYWDDYQGFDRDQDGIGDSPYELYSYADQIWSDVPTAQFFVGSPMLEVVDFLERLAPFSPPALILRDESPLRNPGPRAVSEPQISLIPVQ